MSSKNYYVHETAVVDIGASIGDDTKIWHFSHICSGAVIGKSCSFGQNVFVADNVVIANNVKVQNNVSIYEGVELQDDVFCGPSMVFTNVYNPRSKVVRKNEYRKTIVEKGVTIGANATIVCGVTLGCYAFIGAGSLVRQNVKPYALMVGVPARQIGFMCECGIKIDFSNTKEFVKCGACMAEYKISNGICLKVT